MGETIWLNRYIYLVHEFVHILFATLSPSGVPAPYGLTDELGCSGRPHLETLKLGRS